MKSVKEINEKIEDIERNVKCVMKGVILGEPKAVNELICLYGWINALNWVIGE